MLAGRLCDHSQPGARCGAAQQLTATSNRRAHDIACCQPSPDHEGLQGATRCCVWFGVQGSGSSQGGSSTDSGTQAPPPDPAQAASRAAARVAEEVEVAKGQRTAVITGAVSIVFGVSIAVFISNLLAHDTAWWPSTELLRPFIEAVTSAILPYGLPLAQPGIELATHSLDSQVQRHCVCDQCFVCLCGRCFISSLSNSWTRVAASCSRRRQRLLACDPSRWQRCQRSRVRPAAWTGTSSGLGCRQQRHCWDVLPANARVSAFRWRRPPGQLLSAPQRHDASLLWELRAQHI